VRLYPLKRDGKNGKIDNEPVCTLPWSNCILKITDPGITVGSAIKTAGIHYIDNRVMFCAGAIALWLGMLKGCSVEDGIPLRLLVKIFSWI